MVRTRSAHCVLKGVIHFISEKKDCRKLQAYQDDDNTLYHTEMEYGNLQRLQTAW